MTKKAIFIAFVLLIICGISLSLYPLVSNYIKIEKQIDQMKNITGSIFTGDTVDLFSGDNALCTIDSIDFSNYENFQKYISNNNFRKYNPGNQPVVNSLDYKEKSSILNKYLTNNNFYFRLNESIHNGYLYIKTKQPTKSDIFLYRYNSDDGHGYKVSGKIRKDKNLMNSNGDEYLFNLENIPMVSYYKQTSKAYNRKIDLNKNQLQFIGGYVVSFDGNKIEELIIAWE